MVLPVSHLVTPFSDSFYTYDPYGNASSVTENVPNPFRYIGALWDASTGLYKLGERYYDPSIGRFTQTDPSTSCSARSEGYVYTGDDPVNNVDPSGLSKAKPKKHKPLPRHRKQPSKKRPRPALPPTPVPTPPQEKGLGCFGNCLVENGADMAPDIAISCAECAATRSFFFCAECAIRAGVGLSVVYGCLRKCR